MTDSEQSKLVEMKFILNNIPKFLPSNILRKRIAEHLKIVHNNVACKKEKKWDYAFLTVRSEATIEEILGELEELKIDNNKVEVNIDDGTVKSLAKSGKLLKRDSGAERNLHDQVTPLWQISYGDQLAMKQKNMSNVVDEIEKKREGFEIEDIKLSPLVTGYRNKCEFTFGFDKEGQPTLGFTLGGFREGTVLVANASECYHVPEAMKALANTVEAHVRSRISEAPVFDRKDKSGFWRLLMVRLHMSKLMVFVQAQDGALPKEKAEEEFGLLKSHLDTFRYQGLEGEVTVGSLFTQISAAVHHGMDPKAPYDLISGTPTLIEELDGLKFEISPNSFFQVNKPATSVLYSTIQEYVSEAGLAKDIILLDLCCGTGTIGMMMAPHVGKVIGVELVPDAVEDANRNADMNGISNIEFRCAKVEDALTEILASIPETTPVSVILDPPRCGTHKSVIKTIRNFERISSIVYVSCNPKACQQNYADLVKEASRSTVGKPFQLDRAVPVDMFPMTEHCELVLRFTR